MHRGRITKQGSRLVRWAAVEAVQRVARAHPASGRSASRSAPAAGRNIGVVAAARELTELVFYGLRDGHIRRLPAPPAHAGGVSSPRDRGGRGSCSHDPRARGVVAPSD